MGTLTGQQIFDRVGIILQDEDHARWPADTELLNWLNDGQREIVIARPDITATTANFTLMASSAKQILPETHIKLMDVVRNMGADGNTPGRPIRIADRASLESYVPDWMRAQARAEIKHFLYDPTKPREFWVYPRPNAALRVEMTYSAAPADLTGAGNTISVDDLYFNALVDYVLSRCYAKDADDTRSDSAAVKHYTAFQNALGIRTQSDGAINPNRKGA